MSGDTSVERDPEKRCASTEVERADRTHQCRLATGHGGEHRCICARVWGDLKSVTS